MEWQGVWHTSCTTTNTNSDTSVPFEERRRGINRFDSKQRSDNGVVHYEHAFDFSLQPSRATRDGKPCCVCLAIATINPDCRCGIP